MTLRATIQNIIEQHGSDPHKAAIEVLRELDDRLDLSGNGWFDEDPELIAALGLSDDDDQDDQ